ARRAVEAGAGAGSTLTEAGDAFAAQAGGTSGVLWGAVLCAVGAVWGNDLPPTDAVVVDGVESGLLTLQRLGGAQVGDKTMVDAFAPFAAGLRQQVDAGVSLATAWEAAAVAASAAAEATAPLSPRLGRARPLAARSIGTPDAGATSFALVVRALADVVHASRSGVR
ncbi:MAG: DAK2 domain-containing protein, partial [Actinomycetota bacterium]|nr:DAK2 domain-containing protein [Actinomycetota bacterium]